MTSRTSERSLSASVAMSFGCGMLVTRKAHSGQNAKLCPPEVYMNMTHSPANRVSAMFPLGDITATPNAIRQIPRRDLFAALQDHASEHEAEEIFSIHESSLGEKFFIKTWVKNYRTLVWLSEDEEDLKSKKLLT